MELSGINFDNGSEFMSTVHYQTDVPVAASEPSADTVLEKLIDHYSTSADALQKWTNCMYSSAQLTRIAVREEVQPGSGDIPEVADQTLSLTGTLGAIGGDHLPSAMCVWIALGTGTGIRSGRGGTHPPLGQNASLLDAVGRWDTSTVYWTNVLALAASIKDKLDNVFATTGDINPGIYSRVRRARGLSPFFFELTTAVPSPEPRWLRRRMS